MDPTLAGLLEQCRRDHHLWINGDASGYALPDQGTILGAVGGWSRGGSETAERQQWVASHWRTGRGEVELLSGGVDGDTAWLVMIERATAQFVDEEHPRRWDLRVTEVFQRFDGAWRRVHRHADPLVDRRPIADVRPLVGE